MKRKRKQYSGAFKAQIGLEALTGIKTTAQIARENQVHPLLVAQWKKIVRERLPEVLYRSELWGRRGSDPLAGKGVEVDSWSPEDCDLI